MTENLKSLDNPIPRFLIRLWLGNAVTTFPLLETLETDKETN
jgi:hypothetical protein